MRLDETQALVKARVIIQGAKVGDAAALRSSLLSTSQRVAAVSGNPTDLEAIEMAAEAADAAPSFVQKSRVVLRHMVRTDAPSQERVMSLLRSTAEKVHNQDLSALVAKVEEDPLNGAGFVKVRTLIEELILRLQKESREEQSHDSWCKSETSKAATLKTEAQVSIDKNTVKKEGLESEIAQFNLQIEELTKEIGENSDALTEARAQRNSESLANAATVSTTQEGLDALKLVIEQLSQFYKTSAKATVEMIQYAPDSAYKAAQEEWTGIEGMLSVIQSDFERTIQETHAAEKAAQEAFILAERNYEATIAELNQAKQGVTTLKTDAEENLEKTNAALEAASVKKKAAQDKLDSLVPVCVANKMSDEERTANLQREIASLRDAMDILRNYREGQ
jgi:predicted  nucleic acid-binding Zn-ribbon protein